MLDPFSGRPTFLRGEFLPAPGEQSAIQDCHWARLRAFDQLVSATAQCGIRADQERDLILLAEEEIRLLENEGGEWSALFEAIRSFREWLPIIPLEKFGFQAEAEDPFEVDAPLLGRLGGGVEALTFVSENASVYKFFLFREGGFIGATFRFLEDDDHFFRTESCAGSYRELLQKLAVLNAIGGMPSEVVGVTPEGILVSKQTFGARLIEGTATNALLAPMLIPIPSRFLRCDRDHPRLVFVEDVPWLIADLHERNIVYDQNKTPRIIDLVAAPFPAALIARFPALREWLDRVRLSPTADALADPGNDEL